MDLETLISRLAEAEEPELVEPQGHRGLEDQAAEDQGLATLRAELTELLEEVREVAATPGDSLLEKDEHCRQIVAAVSQRRSLTGPLTLPAQLGPYRLEAPLGRGGMGYVYRAEHTRLGKQVAVKLLSPWGAIDDRWRARFEREMRAVGGLRHPHVVAAIDAGDSDGQPYLVMELLDGEDLASVVARSGRLPIADACEIGRQAALGLRYIHAQGMVHRDLKPSNLILARETTAGAPQRRVVVKILDLGLAGGERSRAVPGAAGTVEPAPQCEPGDAPSGGELTAFGHVLGTLDYMAPEQLVDARRTDERGDLYSLGATLHKLLLGTPPRTRETMSVAEKIRSVERAGALDWDATRPELPTSLSELLQRLLAPAPDDRPASAEEVATALEPLALGADLGQLLGDPPTPQADESPPSSPFLSPPRSPARSARRRWLVASGLVVAISAFVVSLALPQGTLVVEIPDGLRVRAEIDGERVGVEYLDLGRRVRLRVPRGRHRLELTTEDGTRLSTGQDDLDIHFGTRLVLTARIEPAPVASAREVAAWALSKGAVVHVAVRNGPTEWTRVAGGEPLPEGELDLMSLELAAPAVVVAADLLRARGEHLQIFSLTGIPLTDDELAPVVAQYPNLRAVYLDGTRAGDRVLAACARLPDLETIHMAHTELTDRGVEQLRSAERLSSLLISETRVGDDAVAVLAQLPSLRILHLRATRISRESVVTLRRMERLRELNIAQTLLTSSDARELRAALPECQVLWD